MSVSHCFSPFHFPEAVDVELSDEAIEAVVSEEVGQHLALHFFLVSNFYHFLGLVPADYRLILSILSD